MKTPYRIVFIEPDGRMTASAMTPVLPRFIHLDHDGGNVELSDSPEPSDGIGHVDSYARIGSSVWTDELDRDALFVRMDIV